MKCQNMQELLALLADGSLGGEDAQEVENHLAECAFCRGELAALQDTLLLLKGEKNPPIPVNLHQHIMEGISKEKQRKNFKSKRAWLRLTRPMATAAAVLLIFFTGGNLYLAKSHLNMSLSPQLDMAAESEIENLTAHERSKVGEGDVMDESEVYTAPLASPVQSMRNFAFLNGTLLMLGGGLWYYFRRFSREER